MYLYIFIYVYIYIYIYVYIYTYIYKYIYVYVYYIYIYIRLTICPGLTGTVQVLGLCPGVPTDFLNSLFVHAGFLISIPIRFTVLHQAIFQLKKQTHVFSFKLVCHCQI